MSKLAKIVNNIIIAIASIRAGFILAVTGAIAQTFHTYFIGYEFSSFTGWAQVVQAIITAIFLSGGLLFYTVRAGNAEGFTEKKRYGKIAGAFMVFEIFINLYYWLNKIIFQVVYDQGEGWGTILWYKLLIAIPFAIAIPVIMRQYAGEINIRDINAGNINGHDFELLKGEVETLKDNISSDQEREKIMKILDQDDIKRVYTVKITDK